MKEAKTGAAAKTKDHAGKALERYIVKRLQEAVEAAGGLSPNEFGFKNPLNDIGAVVDIARKAIQGSRSKEYCLVVTLDVKNAFNTAK